MKRYIDLIVIETKMTMKSRWRYKIRMLSDFMIFFIAFILVLNSQNVTPFQNVYRITKDTAQFLVMIGFLFWQFSSLALGFSTSLISIDASNGMLELKVQGRFSIIFLAFYKMLVGFVSDLFIVIAITILFACFYPLSIKEIMFVIYTCFISFPAVWGMYGIGLLISSLTIREKNVSSLVLLIQAVLIFVTNVTTPLLNKELLVIPYTGGIEFTRTLFIYGKFNIMVFLMYMLVNICWLLFGIYIFKKGLKRERIFGSFDTY